MPQIHSLKARWILDSRGIPTVHCDATVIHNDRKYTASASVPSGASTGTYEAHELRDHSSSFHGKGVSRAVAHINELIHTKMSGVSFDSALVADEFLRGLDTSPNKSELGANAILGVSMSIHRAFAHAYNLQLWEYLQRIYFSELQGQAVFPRLMCNVINGGAHADSGLSIQEFMIVPKTGGIVTDITMASEVYHTLKNKLADDGYSTALGDEGGFAPHIGTTQHALDYLVSSIEATGAGVLRCELALDCAANEFWNEESQQYTIDGNEYDHTQLTDMYQSLIASYPIISIEDGCQEDDTIGWQLTTEILGGQVKLIGDDLFVTNTERFMSVGVGDSSANGVLIKLNQIGSVSETCAMIKLAKEHSYITAVSHRSGETTDDFIADLAVAAHSEFIKLGAPARGERVAKYNRLLEILDSVEID